jgi:GNAT superfamily N-acetyltransferase
MVAITQRIDSSTSPGGLRPFDVRRDLNQVADLVEQCFADTLDHDGQHYLGQMRAAAGNPTYLRLASAAAERVPLPLSGYVWEEAGRIVGNLTLIPFNNQSKKYYLVANVAVHPNYRRQGIARSLTARAVDHAHRHNADAVWLHVREENSGAVELYRSLGFVERAHRATWQSLPDSAGFGAPLGKSWPYPGRPPAITPRQTSHWPEQRHWLQYFYPPELIWHLSLNRKVLQPGPLGLFYRFFAESRIRQWSALHDGRLVGVLAYQSTYAYADNLWLAANPAAEEAATLALLHYAREHIPSRRALALDFPAGHAVSAIQAAGFQLHQVLIWMQIDFAPSRI